MVDKRHEDVSNVPKLQFSAGYIWIECQQNSWYSSNTLAKTNLRVTGYNQLLSMLAEHNLDLLMATDSDHPNGSFDT